MPRDVIVGTLSVRQALHQAIHKMHMARDTGNREQYAQYRDFFKTYWRKRNIPYLSL